jgi:hypothetical protein
METFRWKTDFKRAGTQTGSSTLVTFGLNDVWERDTADRRRTLFSLFSPPGSLISFKYTARPETPQA